MNADNDVETLQSMKARWNNLVQEWKQVHRHEHEELPLPFTGTLHHVHMDFKDNIKNTMQHPGLDDFQDESQFDLVLDKSTLDCLLCCDDGASGLLCKVYQHLKPGGVYFLVSFHHVDFILPLLKGCPGVEWSSVEQYVVPRKVDAHEIVKLREAMFGNNVALAFEQQLLESGEEENDDDDDDDAEANEESDALDAAPSAWASGTFQPDEDYNKTVNVFICRRSLNDDTAETLDRAKVNAHINATNDDYFQNQNPMVTHVRMEELKKMFLDELPVTSTSTSNNSSDSILSSPESELLTFILPLKSCYEILFTDAEKEQLIYDYFMEDWVAYSSEHHGEEGIPLPKDGMTFETAVKFLETMQ